MAAVFTADYEGLYSMPRKAVGVVCDSAQQNQEAHSKKQMDGNGKPLWRHSASARTFHFTGVRRALPLQKKCVLSNNTMESSIKGCTTGGCVRKSIKLKEFFCSGISRTLDRIVVQCGLYGDVVYGCWDYEHKRQTGLLSRPRRQLH